MENKRNRVLLCLGSNWDKEKNMERAAEMLRAHFVFIQFSQPVYTEPIDCPLSTTFLNRVYSEESPARIKDVLKDIECCIGRKPEDKSCGRVPIDIDLLQWNDQILKAEDLTREYVLDGICSLLAAGENDEWCQGAAVADQCVDTFAYQRKNWVVSVCVIKSFLYFKLELVGCQ